MTAGMQPRFIRTEIMVEGSSTNVVTELERRTPQSDLIISLCASPPLKSCALLMG